MRKELGDGSWAQVDRGDRGGAERSQCGSGGMPREMTKVKLVRHALGGGLHSGRTPVRKSRTEGRRDGRRRGIGRGGGCNRLRWRYHGAGMRRRGNEGGER